MLVRIRILALPTEYDNIKDILGETIVLSQYSVTSFPLIQTEVHGLR